MFGVKSKIAVAALALTAALGAGAAEAAPVEGIVTADNDFVVVLRQGGNDQIVHQSFDGNQWRTPQRIKPFSITRPGPQCSVNVIAWGDGSRDQGLAAVFKSDYTVFTGGPNITAFQTGVTAPTNQWANSGVPGSGQITQILNGINNFNANFFGYPPHQRPGTVIGGTNPWGSQALSSWQPLIDASNQNAFKWVWSTSNLSNPVFSVFRIACDKLVKTGGGDSGGIGKPNPMPGEHFQCYDVRKGDPLRQEVISIKDQFGETRAVLGRPVMHCNPSWKSHGQTYHPIQNEKRHLVCYELVKQNRARPQNLEIGNQFTTQPIVTGQRRMFCVPSHKRHR